ncbi:MULTISPECIES: immunoglobulin-like domain-containing protein [unclassified Listeria]|uniref:immunoglobulin-like domain-containing protein n=1 Tax=unclassified Listeria TaxID=2642072 RepID=UPI000B58C172|nr:MULTISPECIES: immunoglobulin-like domain-containing protein [unclassified Listeria]
MKKFIGVVSIIVILMLPLTSSFSAKAATGSYGAGLTVKSKITTRATNKSLNFFPYTDDDILTYEAQMSMSGNFKSWGQTIHLDKNDKIELTKAPEIVTTGGITSADVNVEYSNDGVNFETGTPSETNRYRWVKYMVTQDVKWDTTTQRVQLFFDAKSIAKEGLTETDFNQTTGHQAEGQYFATGRDDNRTRTTNMSYMPTVFFKNPKIYGQTFERLTTEHGIQGSWSTPAPNNPFVSGIDVFLYDKNDNLIGQTVSDQNGYYEFDKISRTDVYYTHFNDPQNRYYMSFVLRSSDPATADPGDYAWYSFEGSDQTVSGIQSIYDSARNKQLRKVEKAIEIETQDIHYRIGDEKPNLRLGVTKAYDRFEGDLTQFRLYHQDGMLFYADSHNVNWDVPGVYPVQVRIMNMNGAFGYGGSQNSTTTGTFNVIVTNSLAPVIEAGDSEVYIGESFDPMKDVRATDPDDASDITDRIVIDDSAVNLHAVGKYPIKYSVTDKDGDSIEKTVYVTVRDFTIDASDVELYVGDAFNPLEHATANDSVAGDITSDIRVKASNVDTTQAGKYAVTYTATNPDGRTIEKTIAVTVKDKASPLIPLPPEKSKPAPPNENANNVKVTPINEKPITKSSLEKQATSLPKTGDTNSPFIILAGLTLVLVAIKSKKHHF